MTNSWQASYFGCDKGDRPAVAAPGAALARSRRSSHAVACASGGGYVLNPEDASKIQTGRVVLYSGRTIAVGI